MPRPVSATLAALLVALVACRSGSAQSLKSTDTSIGIWPFLVGQVDGYADEIIAKSKATGLDTIYVHVWRTTASGKGELRIVDETRGWKTTHGAVRSNLTLSRFITKAHAANLQVVAVVQCFGSPAPLPSDAAHRKFLVETLARYLFHSYDARGRRVYELDGIALDYVRWFGGSHTTTEVNAFLDALRGEIGPLQIHAFVIAGAYAIDGPTYDNRFRGYLPTMAYVAKNYGQHWEDFAKRIDCLLPMAYTANGHVYGTKTALMEGYLKEVASYGRAAVSRAKSACRVVPAIRVWNSTGVTTTRATIEACARGALAGGGDGYMAFRYFTARGKTTWFTALSSFAIAGPDRPVARLTISATGLSVSADTRASTHAGVPSARLSVALDLDGDGSFETSMGPPSARAYVVSGAGARTVSAEVRDPKGHRAIAGARVGIPEILSSPATSVSAASGGIAPMALIPGTGLAGSIYVVLLSGSGTTPGTVIPGVVTARLPLNLDVWSDLGLGLVNGPFLNAFLGPVGTFGVAFPRVNVPKGLLPASLVGQTFDFAALGFSGTSLAPLWVSNAVGVKVVR